MTTETQAPLSDEEIEKMKRMYKEPGPYSDEVRMFFGADKDVRRLIGDLEAANQRIRELEAAEWKPTHRHKELGYEVRVTSNVSGLVDYEMDCRATSWHIDRFFNAAFEPIPEPEGERLPECP